MVTLTRKTNTVEIVFSGSSTYLYDGTISAPLGCLVLITDQSDMATVRRAPSFDILFSAKIADMEFDGTQATMANINTLFNATCGGGGGGGGDMSNYYTKAETDAALSAATSGKANASDVYTKTEVDAALSGKQDTLSAGSGVSISGNVISVTGVTPDMSNYYTKAEIDQTSRVVSEALHELHDEKADASAVTASISAATSGKANSSDVYTKTEMDTALSGKADSSDVYAKTDVDAAPTSGSTNLLTSGTLYSVLGDIDNALSIIIGGN